MRPSDIGNWLALTKKITLEVGEPNLEDRTFLIPSFLPPEPLGESILRVGMINPPVVQDHPDKGIICVLGRRRLEAARLIGWREVQVLAVPREMPEQDGFALAFWDNYSHRVFTAATKAYVVRRLLELYCLDEVAQDFLPDLELPPKGPRLQRLRLIGELDDSSLQALAEGRLHEKTAALLASVDPKERRTLLELVRHLGLNANKATELISHIYDLSVYQSRSVSEVLALEPAPSILADDDLPVPERAERFRDLVRSWKFPELVKREQEFTRWRSSLDAPQNVRVRPTPQFESDECTVEVLAIPPNEVESLIEQIKRRQEI
ncbi:MAG: ParB N-terminal domain-containing protein, partial [Deltaproteobacteria bacterium]|nr:ParB N-terminal domain-containing protein [Deltaproteobacteria bacterium]